jgi:bifunctional non-homologous end joining protein LigD
MTPRQLLRKVFPPMLATLSSGPPRDEENWTYELKYDGFRAIVAIAAGNAAMLSRNELDLSARFPRTFAAVKKLKAKEAVLDGEIVVLDEKGAPRFQLLQQGGAELLVLFDLLWLEGRDLRKLPYEERRRMLERFCAKTPAGITISRILPGDGERALQEAASAGWEGIIAKRNLSKYEGRRSKEWLKIKALNQQELVIVGWQPSSANASDIGSLHLAYYGDDDKLHYAGKVGTGFSAKLRSSLRQLLARDAVAKSPVEDAPRIRTAQWVRPRLVAQVAFTEWTADNRLRHPSFLGLREDKAVEEVVKEKPVAASTPVKRAKKKTAAKATSSKSAERKKKASGGKRASEGSRVTLTNPDRLLFPRDGITKQDVAAYYEAVAGPMLKALAGRPLALEHWNQGIHKPSWFHQNIGSEGPEWLTIVETPTRGAKSRNVRHLVADSVDALRWLAQMSVLTVHMWSSRAESLEEPDWLIFDLDPAKGKGIEQAIEAAIVVRRLLETLELPGVPKTSGKRGIHVFVPLEPGYTHEEATEFACSIAAAIAAKVPGMTVERALAKRRGRLYLDCMQNGYGKTVVAPYSLRAIDGAPVSAPLKWSEINSKLDPMKFTLRTMPRRLDKVGDLFAAVFEKRARLPKLG